MYIVKFGSRYVTEDGSLSELPHDAKQFPTEDLALLQIDELDVRTVALPEAD